jgi:CheY-like chemotaxis protein
MKPIKQSELLDAINAAVGTRIPERERARATERELLPRLRPLRILLAEDSLVNQKLAIGLLEKYGHCITVANNGQEAVRAWEGQEFDLVLMDIQMPEMDGLEATAAIRAREQQASRHTPILAMTAHALKGDRELCLAAGMDDYVSKPMRTQELFAAVGRVLGTLAVARAAEDARPEHRGASHLPPAQGLVNWSVALGAVQGDRQLLRRLAATWQQESSNLITEMRTALCNNDAVTLQRAAHTLKGHFHIFGTAVAEHLALHIENTAGDGSLAVADAFSKLQQQVQWVQAELREFLDGHLPLDQIAVDHESQAL